MSKFSSLTSYQEAADENMFLDEAEIEELQKEWDSTNDEANSEGGLD